MRTTSDMKSLVNDLAGATGHRPQLSEDYAVRDLSFALFWNFSDGGIRLKFSRWELDDCPNALFAYLVAAYEEIAAKRRDERIDAKPPTDAITEANRRANEELFGRASALTRTVDSMGTCALCGYQGPGPTHPCNPPICGGCSAQAAPAYRGNDCLNCGGKFL